MLLQKGLRGAPLASRQANGVAPRSTRPAGAARALSGARSSASSGLVMQQLSAAPASRRGGSRARVVKANAFFNKIFKQDASENTRKKYQDRVDAINALEPSMQALSDDALRAKTDEFRARVKGGESLDSLLPEAFAVSKRDGRRRMVGGCAKDVDGAPAPCMLLRALRVRACCASCVHALLPHMVAARCPRNLIWPGI